MKLNLNIKNFRIFRGITQQSLANQLGKSKNVISNWERGDNSPNPDEIERLCEILQVTPNQLFGWDPLPEYVEYLHAQKKVEEDLRKLDMERRELEERLNAIYGLIADKSKAKRLTDTE